MGLIKKLLGGVFSLISGVLGFFTGLLGIGKSSEYFLELDEAKGVGAADSNGASAGPQKKVQKAAEPVQVKAEPVAAPAPVAASVTPVVSAPQPASPAKPSPAPATPSPVMATFAPDNLLSRSAQNGRRRPGPSLSPFMTMAKQMKTPGRA